jgi:hypothetical protein
MIRDLIPPSIRRWIYIVLTTAYSLELIFDVLDDGVQTKVIQAAAVLGFTLAAANTPGTPADE